jgi:hypothetical protein
MYSRPLGFLTSIYRFAGLALGLVTANAQNLLTDLGPGTAYGINNGGQVALSSGVYSGGSVIAYPATFTGFAINSTGGVAGVITDYLGGTYAASYVNGTVTNIGLLLPDQEGAGMEFGEALGINDGDQVVGGALEQPLLVNFAFIYSNGTATVLPQFPPFTGLGPGSDAKAFGINNGGQVVGTMFNQEPIPATYDAFIYDSTTGALTDLGPGSAIAINDRGQVLGSNAAGNCIFSNGMVTPIPIQGVAINATGQVVGDKFFYSGGIIDLNALVSATDPLKPFVTLSSAVGINDNLLIAVNGLDSRTHQPHAYLVQAPWITISPGPLTFPRQTIGTVSAAQTLAVTNAGITPLAIDDIAISGDFSQTNNCAASLAPSDACAVTVHFSPTASGTQTGNLTVTTSGVPMIVPLTGTAPIQVTISSSAATTITGVPVILTWQASPGASCTATGGSASDGWTGTVPLAGTRSVTESTAGTFPYGLTCTNSSQYQSTHTSVVVTWPALSVSLTASPTTITSGNSTTLTWTSINAKTCVASGGGTSDGWAGTTRATSGSTAITEPVLVASPLTLTYTLTCSNAGTSQSTPASVKVVVNPPAMSGGGGGALDTWTVLFLTGVAAMRRLRRGNRRHAPLEKSFSTARSAGRMWSHWNH